MSLSKSFSFDCLNMELAGGDVFAYLSGNALALWDLASGDKDYIQSDRNGFSNFACNHKHNRIACIESGLNPNIHVYHYQNK